MLYAHSTTKRRTFKHLYAFQRKQTKEIRIARSTLYAKITCGTVTQKRPDWTHYVTESPIPLQIKGMAETFADIFSLVSRLWVFILKYDIVLIMTDYEFLALYTSV